MNSKNDPLIYYRETIYTEQFEIVSRSTHCPKSRVAKLRTCWTILLRVLETLLQSPARVFAKLDLFNEAQNRTFLHLTTKNADTPLA